MKFIAALFAIVAFALWLEYRHRWKCRRRHNPYDLIDLQEEMRRRQEKENGSG